MTLENNIAMQITIHRVWPKNDIQDLNRTISDKLA